MHCIQSLGLSYGNQGKNEYYVITLFSQFFLGLLIRSSERVSTSDLVHLKDAVLLLLRLLTTAPRNHACLTITRRARYAFTFLLFSLPFSTHIQTNKNKQTESAHRFNALNLRLFCEAIGAFKAYIFDLIIIVWFWQAKNLPSTPSPEV
jgi:hypothetical protein